MRALVVGELGRFDSFDLHSIPVPEPGEGEVRLRVDAVGLGYVDALIAAGGYQAKPPTPYVPGGEIVGTVEALGAGIGNIAIGDRVASFQLLRGGGAAEWAIAPAATLVRLPDELAAIDAAAIMLDYLTAHYALFDRGGLRGGETILVLGAGGGVGSAAVQLAARAGARVIGGASSPEKRARASAFGAEAVVDYNAVGWRDRLKDIASRGVDIVVDPVGGAVAAAAFRSLAKGGRHLVLGFASGDVPTLGANLALVKSVAVIGVDARYLVESDPARALSIWTDLFDRCARGLLRAPDVERHGLADAKSALAALVNRTRLGKMVLTP